MTLNALFMTRMFNEAAPVASGRMALKARNISCLVGRTARSLRLRHRCTLCPSSGDVFVVSLSQPRLAPPGAGLPSLELVFGRALFGGMRLAWSRDAALAAECLATGRELIVRPEQALHVLEIIPPLASPPPPAGESI
jgi:hypothetical protein